MIFLKKQNYFTSSDPHHDNSKQPVEVKWNEMKWNETTIREWNIKTPSYKPHNLNIVISNTVLSNWLFACIYIYRFLYCLTRFMDCLTCSVSFDNLQENLVCPTLNPLKHQGRLEYSWNTQAWDFSSKKKWVSGTRIWTFVRSKLTWPNCWWFFVLWFAGKRGWWISS